MNKVKNSALRELRVYIVASAAALALSACGGGGGGAAAPAPTPPPPTVTVPVSQALAYIVNNGFSGTPKLSGWDGSTANSVSGNSSFSVGPATTTTYNGAIDFSQTTVVSGSSSDNGGAAQSFSFSSTEYQSTANYYPIAVVSGSTLVNFSNFSIPASVSTGATGQDATVTIYNQSTNTKLGTGTESYAISSDGSSSTSALLKFIDTDNNMLGQTTLTTTAIYRVTTSGVVTPVSIEQVDAGLGAPGGSTTPSDTTFTF